MKNVHALTETEPRVPVRVLGRTGTRVSALVLGTAAWRTRTHGPEANAIIDAYLDAGGFTVEVSDADEGASERLVAAGLVDRHPRSDFVLLARSGRHSTRAFAPGADTSRAGLMSSLDASLARLGCEHVDLWLVDGFDGVTPVVEVAGAMEWAVSSGRASQVGVAGVAPWQVVDLSHHLERRGIALAADAQEHHLLQRDIDEAASAAAARGHGLIAGAGLASGVLSGKYRHGTPADSRRAGGDVTMAAFSAARARAIVESLATAADGLGVHPSELALAWQLHTPGVDAVMFGARTSAQLRIAVRAGALSVPNEIVTALDEVSKTE